MSDKVTTAAKMVTTAARLDAVRDGLEAAAPVVRRLAADQRMRAALRDIVDAGREVADEVRRDGGRAIARDMVREDRLAGELEGGARALHLVAGRMARARTRGRRRTVRIVVGLGVAGGAGYAAWRAVQGRGRATPPSRNGAGPEAVHGAQGNADPGATGRAAGVPAPGA